MDPAAEPRPAHTTPPPPPAFPGIEPDRRRRGKIARLPKTVRDRINNWLLDGLPYSQIIAQLAPDGVSLNDDNLSRWVQGGHQDWLRHQQWIEGMRTQIDFALDVISQDQGSSIHQANLHIAATQLIQSLIACGEHLLDEDSAAYIRLVNSISRLSREALTFEKYREACLQAREKLQELRDPNRQLSDDERRAIVDKLDEILGLK